MRGRIAFVLALFTLFLSTETSFMLHFCHDQFVAAAINKDLSSCCMKKDYPGPVFSEVCCELSSFDTQLNDTVLQESSISSDVPATAYVFYVTPATHIIEATYTHQYIPRPPPKRVTQELHILYEQYLI
jgi:hypothetical protein